MLFGRHFKAEEADDPPATVPWLPSGSSPVLVRLGDVNAMLVASGFSPSRAPGKDDQVEGSGPPSCRHDRSARRMGNPAAAAEAHGLRHSAPRSRRQARKCVPHALFAKLPKDLLPSSIWSSANRHLDGLAREEMSWPKVDPASRRSRSRIIWA